MKNLFILSALSLGLVATTSCTFENDCNLDKVYFKLEETGDIVTKGATGILRSYPKHAILEFKEVNGKRTFTIDGDINNPVFIPAGTYDVTGVVEPFNKKYVQWTSNAYTDSYNKFISDTMFVKVNAQIEIQKGVNKLPCNIDCALIVIESSKVDSVKIATSDYFNGRQDTTSIYKHDDSRHFFYYHSKGSSEWVAKAHYNDDNRIYTYKDDKVTEFQMTKFYHTLYRGKFYYFDLYNTNNNLDAPEFEAGE